MNVSTNGDMYVDDKSLNVLFTKFIFYMIFTYDIFSCYEFICSRILHVNIFKILRNLRSSNIRLLIEYYGSKKIYLIEVNGGYVHTHPF